MPDVLLSICDQIWKRAQSEGAIVRYYGRSRRGEVGYFHAREDEGLQPVIWILHPYYIDSLKPSCERNNGTVLTDDELRRELMTLAHEYGHFQSWLRSKNAAGAERYRWKAYHDAARRHDALSDDLAQEVPEPDGSLNRTECLRAAYKAKLSDVDRGLILDEETSAWRYGREVLEQLKYAGLDGYDDQATTAVQIYRYRLGMIELDAVPEHARG